MEEEQKPIVKVCTHCDCAARGSEAIFEKLRAELHEEALVLSYPDCFDYCEQGVNASVTGNIVHGLTLENASQKIRAELAHPSLKSDGAGTKPMAELDAVLADILPPEGPLPS